MTQNKPVPDELLSLRNQIDDIDEELVSVLARRFAVTDRIGRLKAEHRLDSVDPVREDEKLRRLEELAEKHALDRDFVIDLFQQIFAEVVKNHRSYLT